MRDKSKLLDIANEWAHDTISAWVYELGGWDGLIEEYAITDEELNWLQSLNYSAEVNE